MSIFKVTHGYVYDGQGMVNVYYYAETVSGPGTAEGLAEAFTDLIVPLIQDTQHFECEHAFVKAENLSLISNDTHVKDLTGVAGLRVGDGMPTHDSMSFQLLVDADVTRMGRKAYGGVPENEFTKSTPSGGQLTRLSTLADALSVTIEDIAGLPFWIPVICKFLSNILLNANTISGARFARVSTQNTRKGYTSSAIGIGTATTDSVVTLGVGGVITPSGNWQLGRDYAKYETPPSNLPAQWDLDSSLVAPLPNLV